MKLKLWRCENENCAKYRGRYEGETPACPSCGGSLAVELVPTHYLVPAEGPIRTGIGNRMVACDPRMKQLPASATGERLAVTCPKCLASAIFAEDERDNTDNHVKFVEQRFANAQAGG